MQNYIVFGAAGGIGKVLCEKLLEKSADSVSILAVGRSAERLAVLNHPSIRLQESDYTVEAVESLIENFRSECGSITGVVNCIGSVLLKPIHLTSQAEFDGVMQTNVGTSFSILRGAVKAMQSTGGSIVLCASAASQIGLANHEAIAAAKGAIISMARSAAATYASKKIRINVVAPGLTKTPMTSRITSSEAGVKASLSMHPLGRLGEPNDIAQAISFLVDPSNDWITGQVLGVDGGLGMLKVKTD
jgi:3-oxoacyl-[acyl-carrier protein] reductase